MDWKPIESAPRDGTTVAKFLFRDGSEETGVYEPFWCGSDCPCGIEEGDEEPDCWWVNEKPYPTHWKPLTPQL